MTESEEEVFDLTFEQVTHLLANAWEEGYRTNRDKHAQALARLHNPYMQGVKQSSP
jgi:hypothetical protein